MGDGIFHHALTAEPFYLNLIYFKKIIFDISILKYLKKYI